MEPARTPRFSRNTPRPSSSRTLRDIRGPTPSRGSQRRRIVSQDACAGAGTSSRLGGPTSGWHLPSRSGAAAWARSDETPALQRTGSSAIPKDGAFSSSPASQPPRTVRGTALRPTSSWCSPPERKSSSSGQRPLCGRRLDRATPTTRRLWGPIARYDPSSPATTKAKASCQSPSTRTCIGITGAVDRREPRRPRCRDRPIQACAAWAPGLPLRLSRLLGSRFRNATSAVARPEPSCWPVWTIPQPMRTSERSPLAVVGDHCDSLRSGSGSPRRRRLGRGGPTG